MCSFCFRGSYFFVLQLNVINILSSTFEGSSSVTVAFPMYLHTVELQWFEHLLNLKNLLDMGNSVVGLIIAPGQDANSDNLGKYFRLYVVCTHKNCLDTI